MYSESQRGDIANSALNAWEHQRTHLKTVKLKFAGSLSWTLAPSNNIAHRGVIEGKVKVIAVIDFVQRRFRISTERDEYNDLHGRLEHFNTIHVAADGKLKTQILAGSSIVNGREINFILQHGDSNAISGGPLDSTFWRPVFLAAGIVVPKTRITWMDFAPPNDETVVRGFEGYETNAPQKAAIVIKASDMARTEYWTDPARDFLITKCLRQVSSDFLTVSNFLEIDYRNSGGIWLPAAWRTTNWVAGRWQYTEDVQTSEVVINQPLDDDEFRLETALGMKVHETDVRLNESNRMTTVLREYYRVGASNEKIGLESQMNRYGMRQEHSSLQKQPRGPRFAFLGFLLVSAIFLSALILRWTRMK